MLRYGLPKVLCWLVFNNLVQARVISEETTTTENLPQIVCPLSMFIRHFLIKYWSGIAWPTVCSAIPGQVVLCCVRQQPDHNPVSSTPLLYFLPWVLALVSLSNELLNYKLNIPFLFKFFWSFCFISASETLLEFPYMLECWTGYYYAYKHTCYAHDCSGLFV